MGGKGPYGTSLTSPDYFQLVLDSQKDKQRPGCKGPPEAKFTLEYWGGIFQVLEVEAKKLPMLMTYG